MDTILKALNALKVTYILYNLTKTFKGSWDISCSVCNGGMQYVCNHIILKNDGKYINNSLCKQYENK